ncbi:MAG: glycosyltransferase family 4 protein [Chitinophagaceae bacterium]|nr:glycosyltransferase family 4 protein [Chitinophagaceae bacterium]
MKVALITRSTLHTVPGGDTVQVMQTARCLQELGVEADVLLTNRTIDYDHYDVFHYFNLTRPADMLFHIAQTKKPFVVSPVLVDYSEYDQHHRGGISGALLRRFSPSGQEYVKAMARWVTGKDKLKSKEYVWNGHRKSVRKILERTAMVLPNSAAEYKRLQEEYGTDKEYMIVPNGIDEALFSIGHTQEKDETIVLCAARVEGIKNQLNLIKAINHSRFTLLVTGSPAPNQRAYYAACRKIAAKNIVFHDHVPQEQLVTYYKKAKVHALPSWFETCGLSSLEAAAMGCNVAISDKGYTREYFGNDAFYCDPGDPESIFNSIEQAAQSSTSPSLREKIHNQYTWRHAAAMTRSAYQKIISA